MTLNTNAQFNYVHFSSEKINKKEIFCHKIIKTLKHASAVGQRSSDKYHYSHKKK